MEKDAAKEREEYDDLTSRYELLEEEFLSMKNKLTLEKDQLGAALKQLRKEHERISNELKTVRDNFNARQEVSSREKTEFQNLIRELEAKVTRLKDIEAERNRMRSNLNERDVIIEELRKSERSFREDKEKIRRKPRAQGRAGRMRADYEERVCFMTGEMHSQQAQIVSVARERDQIREKLDEALKEISALKSSSLRRERSRGKEAVSNLEITHLGVCKQTGEG
ncbi:conserved hypothetical protein [Ixodes scapularis]|uniref:Uncharacterized protein n=1 Tax=Ixodes scapularis TaxID=6945 RepID=B7Q6D8_IXOSC|nr:conserved hypothetical protein [Ixodes scapularis]|eukprot:XP_002411945.1 conserved hypothetical protein [Ixodes scapularis]